MHLTNKDLYNLFGLPERTYYRRLKELQQQQQFKKKSKGYRYTLSEVLNISKLLGYENLVIPKIQEYLKKKITATKL